VQNWDDQSEGQERITKNERPLPVLFTMGHGTRTLDELIAALRAAGVRRLVDVRRFPRSRKNPQFNREALERDLPSAGISYVHDERLGGRRTSTTAESPNSAWEHPAFRAYADYMMDDGFWEALDALLADARTTPTAIMCSETLWWRCHRRLIADAATARGFCVLHLMRPGASVRHTLSPPGRIIGDRVSYAEPIP
jgi:uncharacterized protein (DUF488 family)